VSLVASEKVYWSYSLCSSRPLNVACSNKTFLLWVFPVFVPSLSLVKRSFLV
jgi:hypothetical protein